MATPFSYTVPNWREGSPSQAEGALLQEAGANPGNSGMALLLASSLGAQRQSNQIDYANELQQQHQFANAALAEHAQAQGRGDLIKYLSEVALKNPAALGLMSGSPVLSAMNPGGFDPSAANTFSAYTAQDVNSQALERVGKGIREAREGGYGVPVQDISDVLPMTGVRFGDVVPTAILAAHERGVADAQPRFAVTSPPDRNAGNTQVTVSTRGVAPNMRAIIDQQRRGLPLDPYAPDPGTQPAAPLAAPTPVPTSPVTGLLPNRPVTPSGPPPSVPQPNTLLRPSSAQTTQGGGGNADVSPAPIGPARTAAERAAQQSMARLRAISPADYDSVIQRAMENSGQIVVGQVPGGSWFMLGKNGLKIPIPGVSTDTGTMR